MLVTKRLNLLHERAMRLAYQASIAVSLEEKRLLFKKALTAERSAAELLFDAFEEEPSRSVLFRSAAALALDCGEESEAERLAAAGLAGNAPDAIAAELREIMERATFSHHLSLSNIDIASGEFQLAMTGRGIASGLLNGSAFVTRYEAVRNLFVRTAERLAHMNFSDRPRIGTQNHYPFYISPPRVNSFAVTIRVGETLGIPGLTAAEKIIGEVVECMEMFEHGNDSALTDRMPKEYQESFVFGMRRLAPDGDEVRMVGLSAIVAGEPKSVSITRREFGKSEKEVASEEGEIDSPDRPLVFRGELLFASSLSKRESKIIKIRESNGVIHSIKVESAAMHDIVSPYYEKNVVVVTRRKKKSLVLVDLIEA